MSVALNLVTATTCDVRTEPSCRPDGVWLYNTDVLYDAGGAALAVYHKAHIFSTAAALDQAPPRAVVAELPLRSGARLRAGLAICYDMEFDTPTALLKRASVHVVLLSSLWESVSGIYSPRMMQQAYSRAWDVALVAANAATESGVSGGSGIYASGEPLASIPEAPVDGTVYADIELEAWHGPSSEAARAMAGEATRARAAVLRAARGGLPASRNCRIVQDGQPDFYINGSCAELMPSDGGKMRALATHEGVECDAVATLSQQAGGIDVDGDGEYTYVLAALAGVVRFAGTPDGLDMRLCTLLRCARGSGAHEAGDCERPVAGSTPLRALASAEIAAGGLCEDGPDDGGLDGGDDGHVCANGRRLFLMGGEGDDGAPLPGARFYAGAGERDAALAWERGGVSSEHELFALTATAIRRAAGTPGGGGAAVAA